MSDGAFNLLAVQRRVFQSSLRPLEKLVALALLDHWSADSPEPYPSVTRLEAWSGLCRHAVVGALRGLKAQGAIVMIGTHPRTKSSIYSLVPLADLPEHAPHQCIQRTGAPDAPVHQTPAIGAPDAPISVHQTHSKGSSKGSKKEPRERRRAAKWRRVPEDWAPKDQHRELAKSRGVNFDAELANYRDHEFAQPKSDADAAFRVWLRRAFVGPRGVKAPVQVGGTIRSGDDSWLGVGGVK